MNAISYPKDWASRVATHYVKAVKKHPNFADTLFGGETLAYCEEKLASCRAALEKESSDGCVYAEDLLREELWEVAAALAEKDDAHAVDEIYDAVAVLLRMAEMIEDQDKFQDKFRTNSDICPAEA